MQHLGLSIALTIAKVHPLGAKDNTALSGVILKMLHNSYKMAIQEEDFLIALSHYHFYASICSRMAWSNLGTVVTISASGKVSIWRTKALPTTTASLILATCAAVCGS